LIITFFICALGCRETTICRITNYTGWPDAVEMSNSKVRVVVAPSIGRIIHYGFLGKDNLLWVNSEFTGKTLPDGELFRENGRVIWANFGGDKVWPTAQNQFFLYNDRSWPPDVTFDGGKTEVKFLRNGIRMTSGMSPAVGARLIREIRLSANTSRLLIVQRMEKIDTAKNKQYEPVPLTIWNATQIRNPLEIIINTVPTEQYPSGHYILPFFLRTPGNLSIENKLGFLYPDSLMPQKVSAVSDSWVASVIDNTVFAEFFVRDSTAIYPDGNLNCKVYSEPRYAQLEVASPLIQLVPGDAFEFTIAWDLFELADSLTSREEKRTAALNWLKNKKL